MNSKKPSNAKPLPDKKLLVIAGVLLCLAVWKVALVLTTPKVTEMEVPTPGAPAPVAPLVPADAPDARANELYAAPRSAQAKVAAPTDADPACRALWTRVLELDLNKNFQGGPLADKPFPTVGECKVTPAALKAAHDQFVTYCGNLPQLKTPEQWAMAAPQCQAAALLYRARIADWNTRDVPLKEITDPKVLADKLMAKFTDNPAQAAEVAERLLDVDPKLGFAAKAAAMGRFMDAQGSAAGKDTDAKFDKALDNVGKMERADREGGRTGADTDELKLLIQQRRNPTNPQLFRDEAVRLAETKPQLWVGPYYAAWGEHKLGNQEKAAEWLSRCAGDARCRQTSGLLKSGDPQAFQSHVTFGLNPLQR